MTVRSGGLCYDGLQPRDALAMWTRLVGALTLCVLLASPLLADTVYLTNGETFEEVIAELGESHVRIRMPIGGLSLPRSQILRVEKSGSPFEEYLRRKEELQADAETSPSAWLELARWAKVHGLDRHAEEAALVAAELAPELEGLAPLLRGLGYALDEELGRWIPYAESMRRRGFVLDGGEWISREEHAARIRERRSDAAVRPATGEVAQSSDLVRLAELEVVREALRSHDAAQPAYAVPVLLGGVVGFFPRTHPFHAGHHRHEAPAGHPPRHHATTGHPHFHGHHNPWKPLIHRQPGSLIPATPKHFRAH